MKYRELNYKNFRISSSLFAALTLVVAFSACRGNQNTASNSPTPQPTQASQPVQPAPLSTASPGAAQAAKPSTSKDGVPEIMKRPMTPEEMQKAMQQLPPEVRARLQGMGLKPVNPVSTPSPQKR